MAEYITKKDLQEFAGTIVEAVDLHLKHMEQRMDEKYAKEYTLRQLMITLDNFLKQMTDYKEKFGVEIAIQG